jgi:hypothetical protein
MPNLKFYLPIDCYFNGFCKDRKNFFSNSALCQKLVTLRYAPYSAEFRVLSAAPRFATYESKIFLPALRYAAQRGVDSALCEE